MTVVLRAECQEPEGSIFREVRLAPLTTERLRRLWDHLKRFPTLFNRHITGIDDFISTFVSRSPDGTIKANGIIWEVDDVGIIYITDIYPQYQATGHFTFWDQRFKGRENLIRRMLKYGFGEYSFHRIIAEVPLYSRPSLAAVEKIGFQKEGRLRKAVWYNGEWWDVNLYSILEEEIDGLLEAEH